MTETLTSPHRPEAETIPEELVFEEFDDYYPGNGIAELPDGNYVVQLGERPSAVKDIEGNMQRYDLALAVRFIEQEPDIAKWYGYRYIAPENGELARVVIPSAEQLNERKNSLPPEIGVNRGVFKVQEGAHFGAAEYLGMLAEGEIPIATDPYLSSLSKGALGRDDYWRERFMGELTGTIDNLSGMLTARTSSPNVAGALGMLHDPSLPPKSEMAQIIDALNQRQLQVNEALRAYARSQNEAHER